MKTFSILVLLFAFLSNAACGGQTPPVNRPTSSGTTIITNGIIVDGLGSEPVRDGIVAIDGNRITFVGKATDYSRPTDAQVIDAGRRTILPGIIDAHVHSTSDPAIRHEFLMGRVTTVCDLGSPLADMPQFNEDYLDQNPVARGFHTGPIITSPGGLPDAVLHEDLNYVVGTPDEARKAVVDLADRGVDVIKVYLHPENDGVAYPMLGEQELAAIVQEAHALGLLVRAHVTYASQLGVAVQAGVDVIEHVPVNATQAESQSVSATQWQGMLQSDDPVKVYFAELYPQYEAQLERMVQAGIVMIPTLDRPYGDLYRASDPTQEQEITIKIILGIVHRFHESGGVVGLGTDYNINIDRKAGMPMGEIEMLLAAGLSPMEVIEAGTRISANVCGHSGELGTLEAGMLADVIVVDGDPLKDLQAMSHVVLVIKNGEIAVVSAGMLR